MTRLLAFFLIAGIALFVYIKKEEKRQKEYCEQYISEVVINDKIFGAIKCEKDKKINTLICKNFNQTFGKYNPVIEIEGYDENENELYFRSLEHVYRMQEEIIQIFMDGFLEFYSHAEEVTREKLEQNLEIDGIWIYKCSEMFQDYFMAEGEILKGEDIEFETGDWVLVVSSAVNKKKLFQNFYSFEPVLYMNCRTKEMCYGLEE